MTRIVSDSPLIAVVLAGGRGTRSANPMLPKILQSVDGITLLEMHLQNFSNSQIDAVHFSLGMGSELVIQMLEQLRLKYPTLDLKWDVDRDLSGTTNAVLQALKESLSTSALIVLGDTALQAPLDSYIDEWHRSRSDLAYATHVNKHLEDSDRVVSDSYGVVTGFHRKGESTTTITGEALTAFTLVSHQVYSQLKMVSGDFQYDLFATAEHLKAKVTSLAYSHSSRDSGTRQRLAQIEQSIFDGSFYRRGKRNRPAIFLDRDNTLMPDIPQGRRQVGESDVADDIRNAIAQANKLGIPIFLVSNQPAVAKGFISLEELHQTDTELRILLAKQGAFLDDYRYCPHHPKTGFPGERSELKIPCRCRKPAIGMLEDLAIAHNLSIEESWLIGDSEVDRKTALAAKCNFIQVGIESRGGEATARAILEAISEIRKC